MFFKVFWKREKTKNIAIFEFIMISAKFSYILNKNLLSKKLCCHMVILDYFQNFPSYIFAMTILGIFLIRNGWKFFNKCLQLQNLSNWNSKCNFMNVINFDLFILLIRFIIYTILLMVIINRSKYMGRITALNLFWISTF